jgi:hypothetical protein
LGLISVSITNYVAGLFTANASHFAIAQFASRRSDPAPRAHTFDQLLKNNPQLLEENRHLMGRCVAIYSA